MSIYCDDLGISIFVAIFMKPDANECELHRTAMSNINKHILWSLGNGTRFLDQKYFP